MVKGIHVKALGAPSQLEPPELCSPHLHSAMGAVHGVHLKYAAMSAASTYGALRLHPDTTGSVPATAPSGSDYALVALLWYAAATHAIITACFLLRRGMWLIGKDSRTGTVPMWSLILFFAFHLPTWLYTYVHTELQKRDGCPVASEVAPGWWIGGRYAAQLRRKWAATVDLTVEFPEGCMATTEAYMLVPCWDGVPPTPRDIERAARFATELCERGDVMVHCAHGKGRSTCVMVACLVRAGLYPTWRDAFEAVRTKRQGVKLNSKMRNALDEWQSLYKAR